jgi:hypothetical protein
MATRVTVSQNNDKTGIPNETSLNIGLQNREISQRTGIIL